LESKVVKSDKLYLILIHPPLSINVNVLNLHRIDLARKYYTHLQREIEKEEEGEKEWKNSH
jgi:hypothetical protein